MPALAALCFARLAIRFAPLAPALGATHSPYRRAHTEVAPEGSRERGGRGKAVVERDSEDALVTVMGQRDRCALEPKPLDECEKRLVGYRSKDAMEMKRREGRDVGETLEEELLGKVGADVVNDAVDTVLVLEATKIHRGLAVRATCRVVMD